MVNIDVYTGDELNQREATIARKIRMGDATSDEVKEYNMISRRMGNVNISLDRQRILMADANGFTLEQKTQRRRRRKKNIKKGKGKK
tara:strand:- start:275 stop:535 length:261 start_codon:yes stop_codon:yes gene_type:complete